jgi:hypothetical protein
MTTTKPLKTEEKKLYIHPRINKTPVNIDSIEAMKPEDNKKVYGEFLNVEYPGQTAFVCCKYHKWQEYFSKTFQDGEKATINLIEARHINERCRYTKPTNLIDDRGNPIKDEKYHPRYKFIIEKYL